VIFTASPGSTLAAIQGAGKLAATTGYVVDQWLVNGLPAQSGGTNFTLLNVTADTAVQVTFKPAPPVSYTVTPNSSANGSISPNSQQSVASADSTSFTASPDPGFVVDQWIVNNVTAQFGGSGFTLANVTADTTVQVTFKLAPVGNDTITANPTPSYGGTVSGDGAFTHGSQRTVIATANPGYSFINWTENGIEVSSSTSYGFTLTTNRSLTANFSAVASVTDTDAPTVLIVQPYSSGVLVMTTNATTLAGTASDLGHGNNGIASVTVNGVEATGDTAGNGGTANWSLDAALESGSNVFTVAATDASSNANSTTNTLTIIVVPAIVSPPAMTNALLQVGNQAVVVGGETSFFTVSAIEPNGHPLYYSWIFGDGVTSAWSLLSTASHAYSADNCGPNSASVVISNGYVSTSADLTVSVACQLNISKAQAKLNFAKPGKDSIALVADLDLGIGFVPKGQSVTISFGDVQVSFTLDSKGRGVLGKSSCQLKSNKQTGLWTFEANLKNGNWQGILSPHGLVNATIPKPGDPVTLTIIVLVSDEAFGVDRLLHYSATAGKSGTAK
jgi:hypothetical protein